MSLRTHHGWCGVGIQNSGWLQSPKLDITGGTLGQEGGVERDGETCVGSEILSRQNLRCVCWRELGREKKKLPMGFPGFLGCPFDWTVLPFTEIEDRGAGYMEGQGPCVQVWILLSF